MEVNVEDLLKQMGGESRMRIVSTDYSMATKSYDIFLSGCNATPKCEDCHNPEAWDFKCGTDWKSHIAKINKAVLLFKNNIDKFFILGGEPLDQDREQFVLFITGLREYGKPLWLFTRFELNEIPEEIKEMFDYIKTGRYIPELSTKDNIQYGVRLATSNQKIYKKGVDY